MLTRRSALRGAPLLAAAAFAPAFARPPRGKAKAPAPAPDSPPTGGPANTPIGPIDVAARWAFAIDFNTGAVLLDKAADERMPPSSMTKLMTLYIVYSRLKAGKMKLDDALPVSQRAWHMGGSKMFVPIGGTVKVEDLIRGIEVDSGNDACIVLAEAISGSEEQFAELMNQTAKQLGLTQSHFVNSTGWPDPNHYMSARDIATLATDIIRGFPEYYHYAGERTFRYNNIEQGNRNPLVQKGTADGLKTGHTEAGGFGLVASASRADRRVILVLNGMDSMHQRGEEGERLMDWAFTNFNDVTLFAAGVPVEQVPVWLGAASTVALVTKDGGPLVATLPRDWQKTALIKVDYATPTRAPVVRGTLLGSISLSGQGVPPMTIPLVAAADVDKLGFPGRAFAVLAHYVHGG